jgi:lipopolysaccharide biosynthesis glycosyltransferase
MIDIYICIDNNYANNWKHLYNSIKANTQEKIRFNIICECDVDITDIESDINPIKVMPQIEIYRKFNLKETRAIYLRWMIPELTTKDKAIYLDVDTVVLGDIAEIWNIDLKQNYIAAVPSYIAETIDNPMFKAIQGGTYESNGEKNYLSGQLVINCQKWREDNIKDKLISFVVKHGVLDEVALDIICANRVHELDRYWCFPASYVDESHQHPAMLSEYDIKKAKLLHWPGPFKPWGKKTVRNYEYYERYK